MTVTLEIPEELARRLGPEAARMSREALGVEAHRQSLWTEAELGEFLGLSRLALDRFLKEHGLNSLIAGKIWNLSVTSTENSPDHNARRCRHRSAELFGLDWIG